MNPKIKLSLAMDHKQCAANAASTVKSHLSAGAVKEAWYYLKRVVKVGGGPTNPGVPRDNGQTDG